MQSKFYAGALALLPFLLVHCAPATSDSVVVFTRTSFVSDVQCQTLYLPTSSGATPPPSPTTITHDPETITEPTVTIPSTIVETAPTGIPYTVTSYTTITSSSTITQPYQTTEIFLYDTTTVGTLTSTSIICTNGIAAPAATITSYSGTYTPISGQPTSITSPAIEVACTTDLTTLYTLYPTLISGVTTFTYTPETPGPTVTSTRTSYVVSYIPPPGTTTITHSDTNYVATSTTLTISTSCPATTTTTYSAKCAPTNLIGNINGNHGIHIISNALGTASAYGGGAEAGEDASKCCQLCVENEGCAAMFAYPAAGNCALVFSNATDVSEHGGGSCGEAFTYGDNGDTSETAGQGFIVQAGCGSIEAV